MDSNSNFFRSKILYKTELCNNGYSCSFSNCTFAHSKEELRTPRQNANNCGWFQFKTKVCKNYYENQKCEHGKKCTFLHYSKQELKNRLPIFNKITKDTIKI
jgi:hypothetical protein